MNFCAQLKISATSLAIPGTGATGLQLRVTTRLPWTAAPSRRSWVSLTSGASGTGNGTLTFNVASNPGPARTSAISVTLGGITRSLRINQLPVSALPLVATDGDFDGDGLADLALYGSAKADWTLWMATGAKFLLSHFGSSPKVPVPADYDGDGQVDLAVYQPPSGNWYLLQSSNGQVVRRNLGRSRTVPVPADYDGDGATDLAVYHPASRCWYIRPSSSGQILTLRRGVAGQLPVLSWTMIHSWLALR